MLLVLSPGPTLAVVTRNAAAYGRRAGLATAAGAGAANATHAAAAALGLSVVLRRSTVAFEWVQLAGAAYLVGLGIRSFWRALGRPTPGDRAGALRDGRQGLSRANGFGQGVLTNLLHPSVAIFYLSYIPQFIQPGQTFLPRYILLASVHVVLSTGWMSACAAAIDRLARLLRAPAFARTVETLAGLSLVALGLITALG